VLNGVNNSNTITKRWNVI